MRRVLPIVCLLVLSLVVVGQSRADDIVQTAKGAGSFSTLLAALDAAELTHVLEGDGPFTVFAPSDEAFAKIPEETLNALLQPENRSQLVAILTFHVTPGNIRASDLFGRPTLDTVNGQRLSLQSADHGLTVAGSRVVATDIAADNGTIHVIDEVMIPESKNLAEIAMDNEQFSTLVTLLQTADLVDAVTGAGPLTVFAPTNAAFEKIPSSVREQLLQPESKEQLQSILKYHVLSGRVFADQAVDAENAATLQGREVSISFGAEGLRANESKIIATDIQAANGVIHVIDTVLMPPAFTSADAKEALQDAVRTGARLFNHGDFSGCCKTYQGVCAELLDSGSELPSSAREILSVTLARSERIHSERERAWALRNGIDLVYFSLN